MYSRHQREWNTIDQYIVQLKATTVTYDFEHKTYDQVLQDQILMKTKSKKVKECLWAG